MASKEYLSDRFRYRIILSHVPFNTDNNNECKGERPFNIERELYCKWCDFIRENIKPDFFMTGHSHICEIIPGSSAGDVKNIGCDTIISGVPRWSGSRESGFTGCALTLNGGQRVVKFI